MTDSSNQCQGVTASGDPCGAHRKGDSPYCRHHQSQGEPGETVQKKAKILPMRPQELAEAYHSGEMSRPQFQSRLWAMFMGEVKTERIAGDQVRMVDISPSDMVAAARLLKDVMPELRGDQDEAEDLADAVANAVREKLGL